MDDAVGIIFLDVDGVLNSTASIAMGVHLQPEKVMLVDLLAELMDAHIVISSTWRHMWVYRDLVELFRITGIRDAQRIVATTPRNIGATCRGEEIQTILDDETYAPDQYVILDDDSDFLPHQMPHLVQTDMRTGMTQDHFHKAIKVLKGEIDEQEAQEDDYPGGGPVRSG